MTDQTTFLSKLKKSQKEEHEYKLMCFIFATILAVSGILFFGVIYFPVILEIIFLIISFISFLLLMGALWHIIAETRFRNALIKKQNEPKPSKK